MNDCYYVASSSRLGGAAVVLLGDYQKGPETAHGTTAHGTIAGFLAEPAPRASYGIRGAALAGSSHEIGQGTVAYKPHDDASVGLPCSI